MECLHNTQRNHEGHFRYRWPWYLKSASTQSEVVAKDGTQTREEAETSCLPTATIIITALCFHNAVKQGLNAFFPTHNLTLTPPFSIWEGQACIFSPCHKEGQWLEALSKVIS